MLASKTLVELIRGQATSDETMATTSELCQRLGKTAVEAADYPGLIANRALMPMINEAIYCVIEGVGTPEAIDTVMKLGMNHPIGQHRDRRWAVHRACESGSFLQRNPRS